MPQRGRKSADHLAALSVTGERPRLTPPSSLSTDERKLFAELVSGCDASHFRISDLPLLISYVQATLIAQTAARDPSKIMLWEKAVRMQATLATRLRLAPQSRVDPKTLDRQQHFPGLRKPWEAPWHREEEEGDGHELGAEG
jgi:hypothetical protein